MQGQGPAGEEAREAGWALRGALGALALAAALILPQSALASQTLTLEKTGSGTGTVTSSPAGIDCGSTCSFAFADNATVLLSGTAGANSAAVKWAGCDQVTIENKCKATISAARTVKASFNLIKRKLSVEKAGTGTGTVTSSPSGIECGATCSAEYEHGTEVALSALSGPNTEAVKWTGCASVDAENKCKVTMVGAKSVSATFNLRPQTLKVTKGGLGAGTVSSKPAGISCGGSCTFVFGEGQQILLSGVSGPGAEAVKWAGCDEVSAKGECIVTMSSAREVGALFDVEGPTLTLAKQGNGEGTVTSAPAGLQCGAACAVNFPQDSSVTLKATSGLHTEAVKWAGCDSVNPKGECLVTMSSAREVSATFKLEAQWAEFEISLQRLGSGKGTVQSIPPGIACPPDCSEAFLFKSSVTLIATPEAGSSLDHWSVNSCTESPLCAITVQNDRTVNAVFNAIGTRTLTVSKAGTGSGAVRSANLGGIECGSACSAEFDVSAKVVLSATPAAGSSFAGWSGEGCGGIKNCRVTMNEARNVTATFAKNPAPPQARCRVPRLRGKSLAVARRALRAAGCSPGKVSKPKGAKGKLVVRSSSPGAGSIRPAGAKVSLRLRKGR